MDERLDTEGHEALRPIVESSETGTDGNAIAGVLQEVFVREVTTGRIACAGCGKVEPIGAEHAYTQAPVIVLRCRPCEDGWRR